MTAPLLLFWIPVAIIVWVYAGYPLLAAAVARLRPFSVRATSDPPALVTIGIAVHNEAADLADRVANALAQTGPFELEVVVASDGSTDASVEVLQRLSAADGRIRYLDLPRGGQSAAQHAIFAAARGDVVVLTDAQTRFAEACLDTLVAPLRDERVACTTGHLVWTGTDRSETARTEGAYWRYEQLVRRLESQAGWLTAVTGALLAARRSAYRPVAGHASMDQLLPLHARAAGFVVLAIPEARATERVIDDPTSQFSSRARVATQGIWANLSMVGALAPWRRPTAALAIWSHKLLRWASPWLLGIGAIGAVWLAAAGQLFYLVPLVVGAFVIALAAIGLLVDRRGGSPPRVTSFAVSVVVVNLAFLVGWSNVLLGRKVEAWHRTEWSTSR